MLLVVGPFYFRYKCLRVKNSVLPRSHPPDEIYALASGPRFYRERLSASSCFSDAPLTNKQTLYKVVEEGLADGALQKSTYWSPTGGSVSNLLLFFPTDIAENQYQRAVLGKAMIEASIFSADTIALNMFGSQMMYRSLEIFNSYCELAGATTLPVNSACADELAFRIASKFSANTIMGLPSRVLQFARFLAREKLHLELDKLIFAGESLPEHKRKFLADTLGIKQFCGLYGSAETGVWSYQPDGLGADSYLFPSELMHVEIFDPNGDGFGRVVATNLVRTRHPVMRYDSGDNGRLVQSTFRGQSVTVLELSGRSENSFIVGGDYFVLDDFFEVFEHLLDYQIQLSYDETAKMDCVRFCLVPTSVVPESQEYEALVKAIRSIVQSNDASFITQVDFLESESLVRSATSQKVRKIVDERPT